MLNKKIDKIVISIFLVIEIALYLSFLILDSSLLNTEVDTSYIKYSGMILCFLSALYFAIKKNKLLSYIIPIALIFTLISDYFLLFNQNQDLYLIGLSTFICAQLIYFAFICLIRKRKSEFVVNIVVRVVLTLFAFLLAYFLGFTDALTLMALAYFVELVCNFAYSISFIKLNKKLIILPFGLLLFIGCDINVALNNVHLFDGIDYRLVNYLMWAFYLPSQVCLALTNCLISNKNFNLVNI